MYTAVYRPFFYPLPNKSSEVITDLPDKQKCLLESLQIQWNLRGKNELLLRKASKRVLVVPFSAIPLFTVLQAAYTLIHSALQVRGTAINAKIFTIKALGSDGTAEGTVEFQIGSDHKFEMVNKISDIKITYDQTLSGSNLVVNIRINQVCKIKVHSIALQPTHYRFLRGPDLTQEIPLRAKSRRVVMSASAISNLNHGFSLL